MHLAVIRMQIGAAGAPEPADPLSRSLGQPSYWVTGRSDCSLRQERYAGSTSPEK
jgi:hypothetical protein